MHEIVISIPFAVVVIGSVLASSGPWPGALTLGVALFLGIAYTGFAIRRHQRHR